MDDRRALTGLLDTSVFVAAEQGRELGDARRGVGNCSSVRQQPSVRLSVHAGGVRLSEWAKREGIHCQTAWKWFEQATLPLPARQTATGTILVDEPRALRASGVAPHARVSCSDQREDLDRRVGRLAAWATAQGLGVTATVAVLTSMCARLYGRRSARRRDERALGGAEQAE